MTSQTRPYASTSGYRALLAKERASIAALADPDDPVIAAYLARLDASLSAPNKSPD
jgi:hypothetical protein